MYFTPYMLYISQAPAICKALIWGRFFWKGPHGSEGTGITQEPPDSHQARLCGKWIREYLKAWGIWSPQDCRNKASLYHSGDSFAPSFCSSCCCICLHLSLQFLLSCNYISLLCSAYSGVLWPCYFMASACLPPWVYLQLFYVLPSDFSLPASPVRNPEP